MMTEFSPEVCEKLQFYVYRLIDPRNGETFYIGKGKGNRVFSHAAGELVDDAHSEKMKRIRAIQVAGFNVAHVIHRHGMDEATAFEVEAALIDCYPGLANIVDGHGNSDFGVMHADELIKKYSAETVEFHHRALLISINRSAFDHSIYEATRFAWRINTRKAASADIVLAVVQGLIVKVFVVDQWLPAIRDNFPGRETVEGRSGFIGSEASTELQKKYVGKKVPDQFRKKGAANPIKYSWE